ncbi:hypothetical protein LNP27_10490 [Flavobacterium galactosidilyticum]|uniref:hypothetical protein n=1 Tax=Flavobacterium galactosidilyticum TaxID=2893886 RepID=UPI001E42DA36|nr:hypothetical protein [Flavobacterium sp. F-340]UFH45561.1 hypothetical protein LNP27_10490 [Flavobacterium sp. F-340]
MKTEKELNDDILEITMKIRNEHPELIKYLDELTITIPDKSSPEINRKVLEDYYQSLSKILIKYVQQEGQ